MPTHQETRKVSNNKTKTNFTPQGTRKRINKAQSWYKEGNNKNQNRNKEVETKETIGKINETKSWVFEKVKIDKPLSSPRRKIERIKISKIRNEKDVTADITEMQRFIAIAMNNYT